MGFFSWNTQDTGKSISNTHSNRGAIDEVTMTDDKGNKWAEYDYDGYGVFGGKDYFELLAEMNGKTGRDEGIELFYSDKKCITPNLTEDEDWAWRDEVPEDCEYQGYFYESEDEEDEW